MAGRNRITRRKSNGRRGRRRCGAGQCRRGAAVLAATTAPLKIGVLNTFSGPFASTGVWNLGRETIPV